MNIKIATLELLIVTLLRQSSCKVIAYEQTLSKIGEVEEKMKKEAKRVLEEELPKIKSEMEKAVDGLKKTNEELVAFRNSGIAERESAMRDALLAELEKIRESRDKIIEKVEKHAEGFKELAQIKDGEKFVFSNSKVKSSEKALFSDVKPFAESCRSALDSLADTKYNKDLKSTLRRKLKKLGTEFGTKKKVWDDAVADGLKKLYICFSNASKSIYNEFSEVKHRKYVGHYDETVEKLTEAYKGVIKDFYSDFEKVRKEHMDLISSGNEIVSSHSAMLKECDAKYRKLCDVAEMLIYLIEDDLHNFCVMLISLSGTQHENQCIRLFAHASGFSDLVAKLKEPIETLRQEVPSVFSITGSMASGSSASAADKPTGETSETDKKTVEEGWSWYLIVGIIAVVVLVVCAVGYVFMSSKQ